MTELAWLVLELAGAGAIGFVLGRRARSRRAQGWAWAIDWVDSNLEAAQDEVGLIVGLPPASMSVERLRRHNLARARIRDIQGTIRTCRRVLKAADEGRLEIVPGPDGGVPVIKIDLGGRRPKPPQSKDTTDGRLPTRRIRRQSDAG